MIPQLQNHGLPSKTPKVAHMKRSGIRGFGGAIIPDPALSVAEGFGVLHPGFYEPSWSQAPG